MSTFSDTDIALAKAILELARTSPDLSALARRTARLQAHLAAKATEKISHEFRMEVEAGYQRMLTLFRGDPDRLARELFELQIGTSRDQKNAPTKKRKGRPPSKWGHDSAGKLMLYALIEGERKKMEDKGNSRPKIQDAIARLLQIPPASRERLSNKAKIRDYAARYSEVKQILKVDGKLAAFK